MLPNCREVVIIRRVTLGQLASHTSGLPRVPQQYEHWHRGKYTWPDFVRFLNSWKADPKHEPGQQYLYSNAAFVLLRVALERRFNTRFATFDARADNSSPRDELDRIAFATRLAWPRRAGLQPDGQADRPAGSGVGSFPMAWRRPNLFVVARHGHVPGREHG